MPNTVKYNTSSETLALKKGNFWIGTNDVGKGLTSVTGFWHGITPPRNGYTIYLNKATNGPAIYIASNDSELIFLTNKIASTNYTTVTECLSWFMGQSDKFVINKDYDALITNGLVYLVDSSFSSSYPAGGTTLYPLSNAGGVGNGSLVNGVSWGSTNGSFTFDGSDDSISIADSNNFNNITWSAGITIAVWYKIDALTDLNSQFRCMIGVAGSGRSFNFYLYSPINNPTQLYYHFSSNYAGGVSNAVTVSTTRYHLGVITITPQAQIYYHDAISAGSFAGGTPYYDTNGGTQYLGRGDNMWKGNIYRWAIYNRALSQTEITQTLRNSGPTFFNTCKTCKDIIDTFPQLAGYDGLYWVYPGGSNSSPYQVYCDMTTDGGGWMLIARSAPSVNLGGENWGWKGGTVGSINDFSKAYQLGWGEIWDGNATFTSFIFGNQRTNFDNTWGPFIYKYNIVYSTFFGSDTQQSYSYSTIKSNTAVYGTTDYPGMQGSVGYTTTGTNNNIYYMRDCCGYAGYGGGWGGMSTVYCGANFYYSGPWCGGETTTGGIYDFNTYTSNGLTYGGTQHYMIMVK
jgi:hypothetical protein